MSQIRRKVSLECGRRHIYAHELQMASCAHAIPLHYISNFQPPKLCHPLTKPLSRTCSNKSLTLESKSTKNILPYHMNTNHLTISFIWSIFTQKVNNYEKETEIVAWIIMSVRKLVLSELMSILVESLAKFDLLFLWKVPTLGIHKISLNVWRS